MGKTNSKHKLDPYVNLKSFGLIKLKFEIAEEAKSLGACPDIPEEDSRQYALEIYNNLLDLKNQLNTFQPDKGGIEDTKYVNLYAALEIELNDNLEKAKHIMSEIQPHVSIDESCHFNREVVDTVNDPYEAKFEELIYQERQVMHQTEEINYIACSNLYEKIFNSKLRKDSIITLDMRLQKNKWLLKALRVLPLCDLLRIEIVNITKKTLPALRIFLMNSFPRKVRGLEITNTQRSCKIIERCLREILNASHKVTSDLGLRELIISRPSLMRLFSENKTKLSLKFAYWILNAEEIPDFTSSLDRSTISKLEFTRCSIIGPSMIGKGFDGIESLIQGLSKSSDFKDSLKNLDFNPLEHEELLDDLLITNNFKLAHFDSI